MIRLKILILFLGLFSFLAAQSHHFVNYKEHGFPSNQIFSLYQDSHGFLWIGTGVGLARYDSEEFIYFSVEDSLPANEVLCMTSDGLSTLWVGTGLGLAAFDISDMNNPKYKFAPEELLEETISSLLFHENKLWIGTDHGLFIYEENDDGSYNVINFNTENYVPEIKLSPDEDIMVLYNNSLVIYNSNKDVLSKIDIPLQGRLKCLLPQNNKTLIGTSRGLFEIMPNGNQVKQVNKPKLGNLDFNRFIKDNKGTIWAGTDKGLLKLTNNEWTLIEKNRGLPGNDIRALLSDFENNFWLGSYTSGLFKLSNPDLLNYDDSHGLRSKVVNCIIAENKQVKLIGTDLGIFKIDGLSLLKDNRFKTLENEIIWFIYIDRAGSIWVGGEGVLYVYNKYGLKEVKIRSLKVECTFLDMKQDSKGTYWICTTVGLFSINGNEHEEYPEFSANGIRRVWSANELSGDRLLFGTDNGYAEKTENGFTFTTKKDGLPDRAIYQIVEDKDKTLWMASDLGVIKKDTQGYKLFGEKDGLSGTIISQILLDKTGALWIASDKGLQKFANGKAGYRYGLKDGLLDEEFTTHNSSLIDEDGNFWLGVFGGLTVFKPGKIKSENEYPPVYFVKAEYGSKDKKYNFNQDKINTLNHSQGNLFFKIRGLYFYNEQSLKYIYKLKGYDSDWQVAKRGESIRYNNLSAGDYKFEIKVQLEDEISDEIFLTQEFVVKNPFWMEIWFVAIVILSAMTFGYGIFYYKTKRILAVNRELQSKINKNVKDLELAEATIENIIEHSGSVLITTDLKGRIATWNKRAEQVFGYSKKSVLHKNINILDKKNDLWSFLSVLDEVKQSGELRQLEVQKKTANDEIVDLIVTTTALRDKEGNIHLVTYAMEDFSERNRLLEFRINREKLLGGIEALNKLLATLSHHINNAIASISGMAQLTELDNGYNAQFVSVTKFQVQRIQAVLKSLTLLVDQLNLKTTDYIGGDEKLFDIENEIATFLKTVEEISGESKT
ncbi:MAG: PAS domain S-box protein [Calditrichaeota bacterium]|nr:MAG: PAS domain S-box protein [Calditrichota bacterium]MBL1204298.1 PAS domain S-box protein [Calditrichota bacterium]NOG44128.1 PAS domain S-box protein [Calditrichota bacterium]